MLECFRCFFLSFEFLIIWGGWIFVVFYWLVESRFVVCEYSV